MVAHTIKVKINAHEVDKDLAFKLAEALKVVSDTQLAIQKLWRESTEFKGAKAICMRGGWGYGPQEPTVLWHGHAMEVCMMVDIEGPGVPKPQAYVSLGEKTINMLLNGKLLDDTQKKVLIERLVPGLLEEKKGN